MFQKYKSNYPNCEELKKKQFTYASECELNCHINQLFRHLYRFVFSYKFLCSILFWTFVVTFCPSFISVTEVGDHKGVNSVVELCSIEGVDW